MPVKLNLQKSDDWEALLCFLPDGWREKAKELGAVSRLRNFTDVGDILRVLLLHFSTGNSLRVTATQARLGGIADISDVGLLKRLKNSGDWLLWMTQQLRDSNFTAGDGGDNLKGYTFKAVDGTTVEEPGATGTTCRIHYSFDLSRLSCLEAIVSSAKQGEGLANFRVDENDVFLGDRAYGGVKGIFYVSDNHGYVLTRIKHRLPLYGDEGERIDLLPKLSELKINEIGTWDYFLKQDGRYLKCRICALKKTDEQTAKTVKQLKRDASRKGRKLMSKTLEYARYVVVLTTLGSELASGEQVMRLYRRRWQIELVFKRLKSLLHLGHLKKHDPQAIIAWIHGKLFYATLIEAFIKAGESFFPWGYPGPAMAKK